MHMLWMIFAAGVIVCVLLKNTETFLDMLWAARKGRQYLAEALPLLIAGRDQAARALENQLGRPTYVWRFAAERGRAIQFFAIRIFRIPALVSLLGILLLTCPRGHLSLSHPVGIMVCVVVALLWLIAVLEVINSVVKRLCLGPADPYRRELRGSPLALDDPSAPFAAADARLQRYILAVYLLVMLLVGAFAAAYYGLWLVDPLAFKPDNLTGNLWQFVYFSVVTLATVGYGDVTPASWIAQAIVATQILSGLTILTVFVMAIGSNVAPLSGVMPPREQADPPEVMADRQPAAVDA